VNSFEGHPIEIVFAIADRHGFDLDVNFSRYFYRPQNVFDEREVFSVALVDVTPDWLSDQISLLRPGWELALNSELVDRRGRRTHIPMIDFTSKSMGYGSAYFDAVLGKEVTREMYFYDSGRSFHAYSTTLLGPGQWVEFMGRLLLLNVPNAQPIVDSRWIGHRLLGGYSALRWSANSTYHSAMPKSVDGFLI
jgi:hypothetical protein